MTRKLTQPKSYRINKNLAAKHGDLMFIRLGVVVKERNHNALKRRVLSKIRDICIGSIENTEFWVRIYSNIGNIRTTLDDVIDAFG
jgi:hypothetical protein